MAKILVVDDEVVYAKMLEGVLRMKGFECVYETDGDLAVERYRKERPDTILLDVNLGKNKKNGMDILKEIRKTDTQTKIIMISGMTGSDSYEPEALAEGATAFMGKPVNMMRLFEMIK